MLLYEPKDLKFFSLTIKYFLQFFTNYFMHLTPPVRIQSALILHVIDHLLDQPTPISSYLFPLISSLPFIQAYGSKTQISRSIEQFLLFLMLNLKLSL